MVCSVGWNSRAVAMSVDVDVDVKRDEVMFEARG